MDTETSCSRCSRQMRISRLVCTSCDVTVDGELELTPLAQLGAEDQMFVIAFLREHGSIRKMEKLFEISYPTVKKRLHALVDRIDRGLAAPSPNRSILEKLAAGQIEFDQALAEIQPTRKKKD